MIQIPEKVKNVAKVLLSSAVICIAVGIGFKMGMDYSTFTEASLKQKNPFNNIRTGNNTSVSVTDRGELLIINRIDGTTMVYENSVGTSIFKSYANKIYEQNITNKTKP